MIEHALLEEEEEEEFFWVCSNAWEEERSVEGGGSRARSNLHDRSRKRETNSSSTSPLTPCIKAVSSTVHYYSDHRARKQKGQEEEEEEEEEEEGEKECKGTPISHALD